MRFKLPSFIIIFSILLSVVKGATQRSVYLLSHQWCRKCDKAIEVLQKIQNNFDKVYPQDQKLSVHVLHSYEDFLHDSNHLNQELDDINEVYKQSSKTHQVYEKIQLKYNISASQVPYPTIWIQCDSFSGIYQNELNYLELQYWINLHCYIKLPFCSSNDKGNAKNQNLLREDYQFAVSSEDLEKKYDNGVFTFQSRYPFVKLCVDQKKEQNKAIQKILLPQSDWIQKAHQLEKGPLFFSSFNHNVRNYLFNAQTSNQSKKLGIFIIFNSASHSKVRQFIEMYKFISDLLQTNKQTHTNQGKLSTIFDHNSSHKQQLQSQYHQSSIKNQNLKDKSQIFKNLAFVGACYSDNRRDCIMKYEYSVDQDKGKQKDLSQKPNITKYYVPYSFTGTKRQNIQRLMQFATVRNKFESQSDNYNTHKVRVKNCGVQIVAFHFDRESHTIKGYEFDDIEMNLGNSFLFWAESVYTHVFKTRQGNKHNERLQTSCLSSQLTHAITERNLTTIKHNIQVKRIIDRINQLRVKKDKIKLTTIVTETQPQKMKIFELNTSAKWKSQHFKYCIQDQNALYLSYDEVISKFSKFKVKQDKDINDSQKQTKNQEL